MTPPSAPIWSALHAWVGFVLVATVPACAYDAPDFAADLFSADGIFLAPDERSDLLEALAALASNFRDNPRIDDGLREKALALALRLDPLHPQARAAHRDLLLGASPQAVPSFDSPGMVAEDLWTAGRSLAEPPLDPEERRLAPFLLELSLLVHPQPPEDRLAAFAEICGDRAPDWRTSAALNADSGHPSAARAHDLFGTARMLLAAFQEKTPPAEPAGPMPATDPVPATMPAGEPVDAIVASLATVRMVEAIEATPVAGKLTLTIRPPFGAPEREWFEGRAASADTLPLFPSEQGIPIGGLEILATAVADRSWEWPTGRLGELRFDAVVQVPRSFLQTSASLPGLVLVEGALGQKPINEAFVLLGELDPASMRVGLPGDPAAFVERGAETGSPYLLVPATILEPLVGYLQKSERLELLFQSEFVSYPDLAGAVQRMTSPTDAALVAASAAFDEIEAASARLPLPELARNPSAQERLRNLLAAFPDHLSARAMLEYGTRPMDEETRIRQFAGRIHETVAPFLVLDQDAEPALGRPASDLVSDADAQFLKLRPAAPPQARNLLGLAEDLVETMELYFQLTNKGTSIATQRLREARTAIHAYRAERVRLGLSGEE